MPQLDLESKFHKLASGTVLMTVGFFANSFFAYLLQLFLGRNLGVEDYGTFNALLSLYYIFLVPAGAVSSSLVKVASELLGAKKYKELTVLYLKATIALFLGGFFIMALFMIFSSRFASYLQLKDSKVFYFVGFYSLTTMLIAVPQAFLQGLLRFKSMAFFTSMQGIIRLIFPVLFVLLGYKIGGIYLGMSLALILVYVLGTLLLRKNFEAGKVSDMRVYYKKIFVYAFSFFFIHSGMMAIQNIDILLVKKYFDAAEAGYYAGTVTLGKVILFGAGSVSAVMFPQISALKARGEEYMSKFKILLLFLLVALFFAQLVYSLLPGLITQVLFGEQFMNSVQYLPRFAFYMVLLVLVQFLVMFCVAIEKTRVYFFLIPAVIMQFVLINLFHESIYDVININTAIAFGVIVSLSAYLYKVSR